MFKIPMHVAFVATGPLCFALPLLAMQGAETPEPIPIVDYPELYTENSDSANFNVEVMRGMVLAPDGQTLYAINSYASSLLKFTLPAGSAFPATPLQPDQVWPTLIDPVALAMAPNGDVLVLGQGTHALARHDATTGEIENVFAPEGFDEPADLVVDMVNGEAYVSCMGSDAVVRIDVNSYTMTEIERWTVDYGAVGSFASPGETTTTGYKLQWKRPRFLHWVPQDGATPGVLYVAPFMSGNNSVGARDRTGPGASVDRLVDGYGPNMAIHKGIKGLPDVDLFRIIPANGTWDPVYRRAGTLMTGHGYDPIGGKYWMLNVDSLNTDFLTEPDHNGKFAKNLASIAALPAPAPTPMELIPNNHHIDLDLTGAGTYNFRRSIPFPYAIEFQGPANRVAVASSTLSRVALMDNNGIRRGSIDWSRNLGTVVRDLMFEDPGIFIYCQQTSNIIVWPLSAAGRPGMSEAYTIDLQSDPTPVAIAQGRDHFYDAQFSKDSRLTCATCHPGGESDMLQWSLRDGDVDWKDPMSTQTLKGLRETYPFHWRGERFLHDFNIAFGGLLGGPAGLSEDSTGVAQSELEAFEAFLFSLRPAANPHELLTRQIPESVLVASLGVEGDPRMGGAFYTQRNCNECHILPTGSVGSLQPDNFTSLLGNVSHNANVETIQFSNFLQAREVPKRIVRVMNFESNAFEELEKSLIGSGSIHNGAFATIGDFIQGRFEDVFSTLGAGNLSVEQQLESSARGSAFVMSLDTGTPPAAHWVAQLHRLHTTEWPTIQDIFTNQVDSADPWVDMIIRGYSPKVLGLHADYLFYSWYFDRVAGKFVPDLPVGHADYPGMRDLADFNQFAASPGMRNVFLGVPLGKGRRLGINFDGDSLLNGEESSLGRWDRDQDDDGNWDGYTPFTDGTPPTIDSFELIMARATHAEFNFVASEEVRWELTVTSGANSYTSVGKNFGKKQTIHIHGLHPGEPFNGARITYQAVLTVWDKAEPTALTVSSNPLTFETLNDRGGANLSNAADNRVVVRDILRANPNFSSAGSGSFAATVLVELGDYNQHFFPIEMRERNVILQIQRRDVSTGDWSPVPDNELEHNGFNSQNGVGGAVSMHQDATLLWGGASYPVFDGQVIVMPNSVAGIATVDFRVNANVTLGQEFRALVVSVLPTDKQIGTVADNPEWNTFEFRGYMFAATEATKRQVDFVAQ